MSWILFSICSAFFLGFYDLAKTHALKDNAVFPVLFFGIVTSAWVWLHLLSGPQFPPKPSPVPIFKPLRSASH
jgi:transporter family protein